MADVVIEWNEEDYRKQLFAHLNRNVAKAALFLVGDIKSKFPGSGVSGTRSGATKAQRTGTRTDSKRSKPGQIPHVQEAGLKNSIDWEPEFIRGTAKVGSTLKRQSGQKASYALFLELGTRLMAARPWLIPALHRNRNKLNRIITKGTVK